MAAVQKNFTIRNGLEVNTDLIIADKDLNKVGIGTTTLTYKLNVYGGIGVTDLIVSSGATIPTLKSTNSYIDNAYINVGVVTTINGSSLTYSNGNIANLVSTSGTITSLVGTSASIGNVLVSSGIVTAYSGIVTYYGDGRYLNLSNNSSTGIGIGTLSGPVGYGITFLNFYGAGVSTAYYNPGVGIATIFFEGGGSGTIGIGTEFPPQPSNGDLFYNIDYGRIFVYYNEVTLGIGSTAVWVDAAPFNTSLENSQWESYNNNVDIYKLSGKVSIGSTIGSEVLTVVGNVSAGQFISTVTSGTAPLVVLSDTQVTNLNASFLRGKTPPSGSIVGTSDNQTLSNKIISSSSVSSTGIGFSGSSSGSTNLQASSIATGTLTLPSATDTLVGRGTTDTLTNKTIAAGSNTITGLTNSNLSGSAGITNSNLANSTISGVSLGSSLASLTFDAYLTSSGSYNGSAARTVSVAATSVNLGNTIVARDISGDFTAGTITATDFNSTSDLAVKENITTFENGLEVIQQLRGVNYTWKQSGKPSVGVIAQEIEEVLPQLIGDGEVKSVNYNGLIGVLIEAVKELSDEVEELKKKIS